MSERDQGRTDCECGNPVRAGMGEAYYFGYAEQYEKEQQQSQGNN